MPMTNKDALQMLSVLREEIVSQRVHIARIQPKADAYDLISKILHVTVKDQDGGMSEDVLWKIDTQRRRIEDEEIALAEKNRREAAGREFEVNSLKRNAERVQPEPPLGGRTLSELTDEELLVLGFKKFAPETE